MCNFKLPNKMYIYVNQIMPEMQLLFQAYIYIFCMAMHIITHCANKTYSKWLRLKPLRLKDQPAGKLLWPLASLSQVSDSDSLRVGLCKHCPASGQATQAWALLTWR